VFLDPKDPIYPICKEWLVDYEYSTDDEDEDKYEKALCKSLNKENCDQRLDNYYLDQSKNKPKATHNKGYKHEVLVSDNNMSSTVTRNLLTTFTTKLGSLGFTRKIKNQRTMNQQQTAIRLNHFRFGLCS
jgi:hypothetical protein